MRKLNVLVTGGGSPGIAGTIYSLRNNSDNQEFHIVTTDMKEDVVGKYMSDSFFVIPSPLNEIEYLSKLISISKSEDIDVIIPQNTAELSVLSRNSSEFERHKIKILLSSSKSIERANNKLKLMELSQELEIPTPSFSLCSKFSELENSAKELGWPKKKVVVKPPSSNGSRGVRIIDESFNQKDAFYNEKPSSLRVTMSYLHSVLGDEFSDLIVMEYLPGIEYTIDGFRSSDYVFILPRTRDVIRSGITFSGSVDYRKDIIDYSEKLAKALDLEFCFGFQFKLDSNGTPKIIESNPRVQGTMVMSTIAGANLIYSGIKFLMDMSIEEFDVDWKTRFYRYWGGLGLSNDSIQKI